MWCPSCRAEYRAGFTHCPDCDVDLVAERPPEEEPAPTRRATEDFGPSRLADPVEVYVGPPVEVGMMKSVLDGSRIPSEVWNSGMQGAYPGAFPSKLVVGSDDAERATELILAARTGELDLDAVEEKLGSRPSLDPNARLVAIFSGELEDGEEVQALLARRNIASAVVESKDEEVEVDVVVAAELVPVSLAILEAEEQGSLMLEPDDPEYEEGVDVEDLPAPDAPGPPPAGGPIADVKPWWRRRSKG
jgi:hypothetical protein